MLHKYKLSQKQTNTLDFWL